MSAEVTGQALRGAMERHRQTAVRTLADMTAQLAEHGGGKTSSVEEEDCLLVKFEASGNRHL